jgi:hypothetical protein
MGARARASGKRFARAGSFRLRDLPSLAASAVSLRDVDRTLFGEFHHVKRVLQSPARNRHGRRSDRHGHSRDLLVRKNILTIDDVQGALTTAQSSLISSPAVQGSLDGARVIGEIKDLFARRERSQWNERRG